MINGGVSCLNIFSPVGGAGFQMFILKTSPTSDPSRLSTVDAHIARTAFAASGCTDASTTRRLFFKVGKINCSFFDELSHQSVDAFSPPP